MASIHFATAALVGLLAGVSGGCASRDVPQSYPKTSAASAEAPEAEASVVTRALESEPPLPGTPVEGWVGLKDLSAAPQEASGHAGHGGHQPDAQAQPTPKPKAPAPDHSQHQHGAQPPQPAPEPQNAPGAHHGH